MCLVFEEKVVGPATHAIVIGVGNYIHLPDGGGLLFREHGGMGQLTSPPYSAREFATWLISGYHNPSKPLASLELLISSKHNDEFALPSGEIKKVERANLANLKRAINEWYGRGDKDAKHLLIFYFCGHGVERGERTSLLLDDFGEQSHNPLEQAVDFREFRLGMDMCKARQQCYFVDVCRRASPYLIERYNDYTGQPIIPGSASRLSHGRRDAPVYYATSAGEPAYGHPRAPSVFTDVLLKALKGPGSDDRPEDDWRVWTDSLYYGMLELLRSKNDNTHQPEQVISVDGLAPFILHHVEGKPIGPLLVGCRPIEANEVAQLSYSYPDGSNKVDRPDSQRSDWCVEIEVGDYRFSAEFPGRRYHSNHKEKHIRPPFRPVHIEVTS